MTGGYDPNSTALDSRLIRAQARVNRREERADVTVTTAGSARSPKPRLGCRDPGAAHSPNTTPMRM
jgi:hypothetical protein